MLSFFSHSTLKMFHYLLVSIVASKKSVIIQILVLLYTMSFFRLLLRFSLALIFSSLITVHLDIQFFECFLVGFCWVSQISKFTPFTNLGWFPPLFLQYFSTPHSFSCLSGTCRTPNFDLVILSHRYLRCRSSFVFQIFSLLIRLDYFYCSILRTLTG